MTSAQLTTHIGSLTTGYGSRITRAGRKPGGGEGVLKVCPWSDRFSRGLSNMLSGRITLIGGVEAVTCYIKKHTVLMVQWGNKCQHSRVG